MGLVRRCACGHGESSLGRTLFVCEFSYLQILVRAPVKKDVKIRRSGGVGEVLAEDPGLAVKAGPGGAGRRRN